MSHMSQVGISFVKQYWNSRPCNIRHSPLPVGTAGYFGQVERRKYYVEPHIPAFAQFPRWQGKRVLEIGCGIGTDTMNFARAGATVTAVDLSVESLKIARQRADIFNLAQRIRFIEGNAEYLESYVPLEHYDLVYSFGVIHHTPHPDHAVAQIRKYLGKESEFRLMVYNRVSWKVLALLIRSGGRIWDVERIIARHSEAQTGCPVTYTYTKRTLERHLLKDFRVSEISIEHIFPYQVGAYRRYEYRLLPWFRLMPRRMFTGLEHVLGWHLCAVAHI